MRLHLRRRLTQIGASIVTTLSVGLLTFGLANGVGLVPGFEWDPAKWASDVAVFGSAIALVTGFVRQTIWKTLDGVAVNVFTMLLGIGGGVILFRLQHFDSLTGGISHGIQAAVASWVMVEGARRALNTSSPTKTAVTALAGGGSPNQITDFIITTVRNLLPGKMLTAGLAAVSPLIAEFAQGETVLTDDRRFQIHRRILAALRAAGMEGVDL